MQIIGRLLGINTSDGMINLSVCDEDKQIYNIKALAEETYSFKIGHVYQFEVRQQIGERISYILESSLDVEGLNYIESDMILRKFFNGSPMDLKLAEEKIYAAISEIKNKVIYDITKELVDLNKKKFFIYPAASRMHHSYVGGLAYHCYGMLQVADAFMLNYPYLNKDYLYAGIILHDIGKIDELSGPQNTEYTLEGQLLGHLVIGALEIAKCAEKLGYNDREEVMILEHMLVSHHGQPIFGAAKKPATPEALALWYIDTIDSKFRVLGDELAKVESGNYTENIGVLDKTKIYKV